MKSVTNYIENITDCMKKILLGGVLNHLRVLPLSGKMILGLH